MPTSRNSPTSAEINDTTGVTDNVTVSKDQPVVSDGEISEARVDEQQDVSGDYEKQYPEPVDENDERAGDEKLAKEVEEEAEAGSTWARYKASGNHMRGLTVEDQRAMGVPEDAVSDNAADAKPRTLEGDLAPGLWFTMQNRFRADVSEAHPILREYLDEDPDFDIKTY